MQYWVQSQNWLISVCFQGKPFNITVIQVHAPTTNAKETEVEQFYEDLQDFPKLTPKKRCPFHYRRLECRTRKSDTWSNRQIWPWSTKWSRPKANRVLPRGCTGHCKYPLSQHKGWPYTWTSPDGQYQNHHGEALYSQEKQDMELTVAQTMNSLLSNSDLNWRK